MNHLWKLHRVQSLGCEHSLNDNACLMVCESPASRKDLLYGALQEILKRGIQSAIGNVVVCQKIFKDLICEHSRYLNNRNILVLTLFRVQYNNYV